MAEILSLRNAIEALVDDGQTVALEGFTHLIPHAAGHELVRQGRRDLTLVRMTPDVIYDQLIGSGCARRLVFGGAAIQASGRCTASAMRSSTAGPRRSSSRSTRTRGWPRPMRRAQRTSRSWSCAATAAPTRGADPRRSDRLPVHRRGALGGARAPAGRGVSSMPSRPSERGNVQLWGISVGRRRSCSARGVRSPPSRRSSPNWSRRWRGPDSQFGLTAVPFAGGARPSHAHGYYERDNDFYVEWDEISRDRGRFTAWMREHVIEGVAA